MDKRIGKKFEDVFPQDVISDTSVYVRVGTTGNVLQIVTDEQAFEDEYINVSCGPAKRDTKWIAPYCWSCGQPSADAGSILCHECNYSTVHAFRSEFFN